MMRIKEKSPRRALPCWWSSPGFSSDRWPPSWSAAAPVSYTHLDVYKRQTVDYLLAQGEKVGLVNVHLYRPFSAEHFLKAVPATAKKMAVLDRTKEPGAMGEPLYQDVCSIYKNKGIPMDIVGGRYGLSSKDTTPGQILAVYENLKADTPKMCIRDRYRGASRRCFSRGRRTRSPRRCQCTPASRS